MESISARQGHVGSVNKLSLGTFNTPYSDCIASCGNDGFARVWDTREPSSQSLSTSHYILPKPALSIQLKPRTPITSTCFSKPILSLSRNDMNEDNIKKAVGAAHVLYKRSENSIFLTTNNTIYEYDLRKFTGSSLQEYTSIYASHEDEINNIAISPDGMSIISCSDTGLIYQNALYTAQTQHKNYKVNPPSHNIPYRILTGHDNICSTMVLDTSVLSTTHNMTLGLYSTPLLPPLNFPIFSGGYDCRLALWDIDNLLKATPLSLTSTQTILKGKDTKSQIINPPFIHSISASADSRVYASGLGNGSVGFYASCHEIKANLLKGTSSSSHALSNLISLGSLKGHNHCVLSVSFPQHSISSQIYQETLTQALTSIINYCQKFIYPRAEEYIEADNQTSLYQSGHIRTTLPPWTSKALDWAKDRAKIAVKDDAPTSMRQKNSLRDENGKSMDSDIFDFNIHDTLISLGADKTIVVWNNLTEKFSQSYLENNLFNISNLDNNIKRNKKDGRTRNNNHTQENNTDWDFIQHQLDDELLETILQLQNKPSTSILSRKEDGSNSVLSQYSADSAQYPDCDNDYIYCRIPIPNVANTGIPDRNGAYWTGDIEGIITKYNIFRE